MAKGKTASKPQPEPTKSSGDGSVGMVREQKKRWLLPRLFWCFAFIGILGSFQIVTHYGVTKVEMGQKKAPTR